VQDLNTGSTLVNINHDSKIDFLELNARANKLLFRDKRRQLYLYNLKTQVKNTLLNYCNYAQWVPDSEVVVA
jgi:intraflagellar transport protein 172